MTDDSKNFGRVRESDLPKSQQRRERRAKKQIKPKARPTGVKLGRLLKDALMSSSEE